MQHGKEALLFYSSEFQAKYKQTDIRSRDGDTQLCTSSNRGDKNTLQSHVTQTCGLKRDIDEYTVLIYSKTYDLTPVLI